MLEYFNVLWNYIVVSSPYLIFGLMISGLIHQVIPISSIEKWLGRNNLSSVFRASIVGVPLPLCSCSVIPTAVTLRKSGASNGATSAFLISTPESGIDSISLTYALIDLPMTIIRPVAAFCSAFIAGILQFRFNDFIFIEDQPKREKAKTNCCVQPNVKNTIEIKRTRVSLFFGIFEYGFGKLLNDISVWLTVGIVLGALIDFIIPANFFSTMGIFENRIMILLIGVPLYICASASTPIAVSLMLKGLSPGSALLFLLVGPATNISNIVVLQKYIGKKGVLINIISIVMVALGFSFLTDWIYKEFFVLRLNSLLIDHNHGHMWWEQVCGIFLIILLVKGIFIMEINPRFKSKRCEQ